ncbi:hypothetical protein [Vibrio owensii]|uniref:hypothetical protein n=1 Tax=Vibrio owensii TaxID=696485 RepID=UPI003CC66BCC
MINVTFESSDKNAEMKFAVSASLLGSADQELAQAIVNSIDTENAEFQHLFDQEKYDVHAWDLTDDESQARFINGAIQAQTMAVNAGNPEEYDSYLTECLDSVLTDIATSGYNAHSFYSDTVESEFGFMPSDIIGALGDLDEVDQAIFDGDFEDLLRYAIEDKMAANDKSKITDLLNNHVRVEFVYAKGFNWEDGCTYSRSTAHDGNCSCVETITVDENLQTFFDMAKVSPKNFVEYLTSLEVDNEVIEKFNSLDDNTNGDKPLMTCESIWEVIENASYGGMALYTAFINASEFIQRDITKGFYLDNGVIGLEDLGNGSGHNESLIEKTKIFIPADDFKAVKANYGNGYDVRDNVYGYYRPALYANLSQDTDVAEKLAA